MDCTYKMMIDGKEVIISSLLDLSKYYYRFGGTLESRRIFDSSEDVNSVIKKFLDRVDEIKNDSNKVAVSDFVVDEKPELFQSMNLTKTRLNPKYIEENRIVSHILSYLKNYIGKEVKSLEELEKEVAGKEQLVKIFNEQLSEIKNKIEVEQVTKNLSIDIHKGLEKVVRGESISSVVEYILSKNKDVLNNTKSWRAELESTLTLITRQLINLMGPKGYIYTELQLDSSETASIGIKGTIDILVIDSDGKAHIFDLKISKDKYNNWDSAKVLKTDWQMAFYRGLLSQYIPSDSGDITLNILPISIGEIDREEDKDGNVKYTAYADRFYYENQIPLLGFPNKGLHENGVMTRIVSTILPPLMTIKRDEESLREFTAELGILIPNYEIKTTNAEYNVDRIVEAAVKNRRFEINNNLQFETEELKKELEAIKVYEQNYKFIFDEAGMTLPEKTEKFRKAVEIYVEYAKKHKTANIRSLKNTIKNSISSKQSSIAWGNKEVQVRLNNLLKPYLLGNYKLIDAIQELDDLGFILLQNTSNNDYVLFSITSFLHEANYDNDLLFGDLEYLKSLFFFDKFKNVLKIGRDRNKIEAINVFNLNEGTYFYRPLEHQVNKYAALVKSKDGIGLKTDFNTFDYLRKPEEVARQVIKNVLRGFVGTDADKSAVSNILEPIINQTLQDDMSSVQLKEVFKQFLEKFPRLKKMENKLSFNDDTEYLFAMLGYLITLKEGLTPFGDAVHLKNFAFSFADFKSIFMPLMTDKESSYDKDGKKVQGIIGGLSTGTPDKMYSADLRNVNSVINNTTAYVRQVFYKQSTVLSKLTRQYFKDIAYTPSEQNWLGNYRSKFESFWVKENGDISNAWRVKNPYENDVKNSISDAERKYLISILFEINRWRLGISDTDKIDLTSLETLAKTSAGSKVLKDIQDGTYFSMPLVRNQQVTRGASLYRTGSDKLKLLIQESRDFFDGRELEEDDRINISKNNMGLYEMYNIYEMQLSHPSIIKEHVNKNGSQYYELNLDIIAHRVAFNKIRQNAVNNILPTIISYMNWMKLRAGIPDENISNVLDYVAKRIKIALEDSPIVEDEFKDVVTAAAPVKAITTAGMLAFRPTLLFKELVIGLYKGVSLAATKIYGKQQFGLKSYLEATKKLATISNKFGTEWNLIDAFNNFYGFANRDVNSGPQRLQTNRRGILMGLSPWMYSTSTLPDYYNRLSLFIAKTIEDGSYDAHYLEDGFLKYDPRKDKRFSLYFEKRESYKNSKGDYIPAKNNEEYNRQRNLYILTMNEINDVMTRQGHKKLEEIDLIPQAYSEKENLSFRSFIDTVYGYYNKDAQSLMHNTWYGIIFLQFMQFWPGKMSQWFGKKIDASESIMGEHVQASIERDGKKILLWREPVYSELDPEKIIDFKPVEYNTGDPWLEWKGTPQEGLVQSMLKSLRYVLNGDMEKFKSDELLKNRALFGLADGALMILIFGLIGLLLDGWMEENGTDGIDGQTIAFIDSVNRRVVSEANVWQSTFGAVQSTPAFWSYGSKILNDVQDVFEGDKTINDFSKNIKALEIFNLE